MPTTEKQASERFLRLAHRDIQNSTSLPEFQDDTMPGVLERPSLLTMTRLWDAETWVQHKAIGRWWMFIKGWPSSSILRAIRLPLSALTAFAACAIGLNQLLVAVGLARLTLPLAPLSLQASTVGLLFRNNQTHDRLKEAQRALGGLGALGREVLHLLLVHAPPERTRDVAHAARLLALFGWALKAECRGEPEALRPLAEVLLLPRTHAWLLAHECRSTARTLAPTLAPTLALALALALTLTLTLTRTRCRSTAVLLRLRAVVRPLRVRVRAEVTRTRARVRGRARARVRVEVTLTRHDAARSGAP
jgi:hypothetical protein